MPAQDVQWLPGRFRRLLHAIPNTADYLDFHGVTLLWAACGAPAMPWTGSTPPFRPCPDCERITGTATVQDP